MTRRFILALAAPVLAAVALPALADGIDCRCRYQGQYFEQGETVCIRVDGQARLARCEMVLNNSSWTFLRNGCPSAMMTPAPSGLLSTGPAISPL